MMYFVNGLQWAGYKVRWGIVAALRRSDARLPHANPPFPSRASPSGVMAAPDDEMLMALPPEYVAKRYREWRLWRKGFRYPFPPCGSNRICARHKKLSIARLANR
jgi:hypothetical protein